MAELEKNRFIKFMMSIGTQKPTLIWIAGKTKPYLHLLAILLAINIVTSGVAIVLALVNRNIIDTATAGGTFTNLIVLYVAVLLFSLAVGAVSSILSLVVDERFSFGIRMRIYDSVMRSCWDKISKYHSGDVITRLSSDVDIVAKGVATVIPSIISLGTQFIMAFVTLAYFEIGIALFALFLGPVTALIGIVFGRLLKPLQEKLRQTESAYKSYMQESVANITIYKAFEAQDMAYEKMSALRSERMKWLMKRQKLSALSSSLLSLSFQTGYMGAFIYSTLRLSRGLITFGTMSIFLTLVSQIQAPIVGLSHLLPQLVSIITSANRVIEIGEITPEDMGTDELESGALGLDVKNVSFSYEDDNILNNASVTIYPGQFVSMMGSSGIGKTTFLRLIMAYVQPSSGTLEIFDSKGNNSLIRAGSREYISYVPQGNTLISGTIRENILLSDPNISEEGIWELLRVVAVDEFVMSTSHGLNTVIGERGLGLSEGQAQRIAIARALAKKVPLLILDEATSALDEDTELAVLQHLKEKSEGLTCILITHRSSVLTFCDRCIRIDNKQIIEDSERITEAKGKDG